jgi:hypothetical protein
MEHLNALRDTIEAALAACEEALEATGSYREAERVRACASALESAKVEHDGAYSVAHAEAQRRRALAKYYTAMAARRRALSQGEP